MKLVQGSCELTRGENIIFLVIFFSAYFKCSVEWRGENLTLTQHSLAVVNHESGFEILRSKVKLVFSSLNTGEKHKFELAPANWKV